MPIARGRSIVAGAAGFLWLASSSVAHGEPRPYRGPHPIDELGEWHEESSVHVHDSLPVGTGPFVELDGVLVFLGDPVAYGYRGTVWSYRGAHPLPPAYQGECGLSREHRHPFAPEGDFRREADGVHVFIGALRGARPIGTPHRETPREPVPPEPEPVVGPLLCTWCVPPLIRHAHDIGPAPHHDHARRVRDYRAPPRRPGSAASGAPPGEQTSAGSPGPARVVQGQLPPPAPATEPRPRRRRAEGR